MAQLKNLIVNGVTRLIGKVYASDSVESPSFIGDLTGTAQKTKTEAGSANVDQIGRAHV